MGTTDNECKRLEITLDEEELGRLRSENKSIFGEKLNRLEVAWKEERKDISKLHRTLLEMGKNFRDLADHPTEKEYKESDAKLFMNTIIVFLEKLL